MKEEETIIVRETCYYNKSQFEQDDEFHKYNIYIPITKDQYLNIFTCTCCNGTFTRITKEIEEDNDKESRFSDTYPTVSDISIPAIENWIEGLNEFIKTQEIENAIEILTKILDDKKTKTKDSKERENED